MLSSKAERPHRTRGDCDTSVPNEGNRIITSRAHSGVYTHPSLPLSTRVGARACVCTHTNAQRFAPVTASTAGILPVRLHRAGHVLQQQSKKPRAAGAQGQPFPYPTVSVR